MEASDTVDREFSSAIRTYIGFGVSSFPRRDPDAVLDRFGAIVGAQLLDRIERLFTDLDCLAPDWRRHSLLSAKDWAEAEMRARHPKLHDDAIVALGWAFSYDWK